jgi:DNA processing protein
MSDLSLDEETQALLKLHLVPGLGPRLTRHLLERFGSAVGVLAASLDDLSQVPHLSRETAARILQARTSREAYEAEVELLRRHSVRLVRQGDPDYPGNLANIPDPPTLLYVRGTLLPSDQRAVAIVGSRHGTAYGRRIAEQLAVGLAKAGFTVVSGLARGIDAAAHRGALAAGGRTLAVLAGGLASIYPPEHDSLAQEVVAAGALLSEAPMRLKALPQMFPQRNRIISGLVLGVVIVEAALRSGALLTAHHAAEQGREVFAVPGPVDSETSAGTNRLLRDGAILVRNASDIVEVLQQMPPWTPADQPPSGGRPRAIDRSEARQGRTAPATDAAPAVSVQRPALSESQQRVLAAWGEDDTVLADDLVVRSELPASDVSHILFQLELAGLVRRLPGQRYERRG